MFQAVDQAVSALKEALGRLGLRTTTGTVSEHWEGTYCPDVMVIISTGLGPQDGPMAELTVYPLGERTVEVGVEVTIPAQSANMPLAQLWERAKAIVGSEVGISGVQRYFRSETARPESGRSVHISLDSKLVFDYWFEVEVPQEDDEEAKWDAFEEYLGGVAGGVSGLLRLGDDSESEK